MARTVNTEEYAAKRREILDVAQRLVLTRGYEQVSIQDIRDELGISSGAFHHYFASREALLGALIERMQSVIEPMLLAIVHAPNLTAIQKLQGFFNALDSLRMTQRAVIVDVIRIWYTDANAVIRQRLDEVILERRAPMLTEIVRQGVQEGLFKTAYAAQAGEIILALLNGMSANHVRLMLALIDAGPEDASSAALVEQIVTRHAAYLDAIERVLGAPPGTLERTDAAAVMGWVTALRGNSPA